MCAWFTCWQAAPLGGQIFPENGVVDVAPTVELDGSLHGYHATNVTYMGAWGRGEGFEGGMSYIQTHSILARATF